MGSLEAMGFMTSTHNTHHTLTIVHTYITVIYVITNKANID